MLQQNYRYDVAFSFLQQDEDLALELNDLLQDRLETFLYSKRQGELAGTDGEHTFGEVFGEQSRIVVVLYRQGWGQTSWTRIEETAIRNRAFDGGYEFVVFVPLDDSGLPRWLPRTQIWVGLSRWGARGAAAVIEARVQDAGGEFRLESVEEKATRLKRSMAFDEKRKRFLNSSEGVSAARNEVDNLVQIIQAKTSAISQSAEFVLKPKIIREGVVVCAARGCLEVIWAPPYSNTLNESCLEVSVWTARPPSAGGLQFDNPKRYRNKKLQFNMTRSNTYVWTSGLKNEVKTSEQLADHWLGELIQYAHDQNLKRPR